MHVRGHVRRHVRRLSAAVAAISLVVAAVVAVASRATSSADRVPSSATSSGEVRLGYFPNLTHATAIVGVERGLFAKELGDGVKLSTPTFNAGPAAIEALFSGAIDATYVGPNPAINAFVKSKGQAVRVVAGATSGGAFFVVDPGIERAADLKGKRVASPQLGNTQDVALRAWLAREGLRIELKGRSEVEILPQENAQTLDAFKNRQIAGAWVPEPWASRLILEGGGKVLVDERDLWPGRAYVTTHLLVRTGFLSEHPERVRALLRAHVDAGAWLASHPDEAKELVNGSIARITGRRLEERLVAAAWKNLSFTNDPLAASLERSAQQAQRAGLLDLGGLDVGAIYELAPLNEVLKERGLAAIRP
jgi:NitT/TauT family transport system substrate-binding protein